LAFTVVSVFVLVLAPVVEDWLPLLAEVALELSFATLLVEPLVGSVIFVLSAYAAEDKVNAITSAEADPKSVYLVIWHPFERSSLPRKLAPPALERVLRSL